MQNDQRSTLYTSNAFHQLENASFCGNRYYVICNYPGGPHVTQLE